ncbi:WSC-domain-containing protein [Acephala macrosclerotiorum]|nr:WSC-domain-containing protein [Acephala macrosclerotiorum]
MALFISQQWTRFIAFLSLFLAFTTTAQAQSTTATTESAATATASIFPAPTGWSYYGCYNETTLANGTDGLRALNGGVMEDLTTMTVPVCLAYCQSNSYSFAGLEYTRECYCAQLLSAISNKLPESSCNLPCIANDTQICGGNLALSVYQTKSSTKGAGVKVASEAPVGSILALGIAMGVLFCLA